MTGMKYRTDWCSAGALFCSLILCAPRIADANSGDTGKAPRYTIPVHYINNASCPLTVLPSSHYSRDDKDSLYNPYNQYKKEIFAPETREKYLRYCTGLVLTPGETFKDALLPAGDELDINRGAGIDVLGGGFPQRNRRSLSAPDPLAKPIPYEEVRELPNDRPQETSGRQVLNLYNKPTELSVNTSKSYSRFCTDSSGNKIPLMVRACVVSEKAGKDAEDPGGDSESVEIRCCSEFLPDSSLTLMVPRADLLRLAGYTGPMPPPAPDLDNLTNLDSFDNCFSSHPALTKEGDKPTDYNTKLQRLSEAGEEILKIKAIYVEIKDKPKP